MSASCRPRGSLMAGTTVSRRRSPSSQHDDAAGPATTAGPGTSTCLTASRGLRTSVRAAGADDPARRPRLVLRVGRAARRPAPARAARDRRRRGRARGELRGEGVRVRTAMGGRAGAAALPARGRRAAAHVGVLRGEQGGLPRVRATTRRSSRGSRSTRRSSTCAGSSTSAARRPRSRARLQARRARAGRAADHGRRRVDEVRRQGGERGRQARRAAARARGRRARVPAPAAGRARSGASARSTARKLHAVRAHDGRRGRGAQRADARRTCSAARRAGTCTRSPTPATRGACTRAGGARSIGGAARARLAGAHAGGDRRDADRARRARDAPDARGRPRRAHRHAAAALRRLLARDPLAHARRARPRTRGRSSPSCATCFAGAQPLIERQGLTLVGIAVEQPRGRLGGPAHAPARRARRRRPRRRARRGARALRLGRDHPRGAARPRPRLHGAAAPRLIPCNGGRRSGTIAAMETFDAIVIGAGPAGEVCAGRLGEAGLERRRRREAPRRRRVLVLRLHAVEGAAAPGRGDRRGAADPRRGRGGDRRARRRAPCSRGATR